MEKKKLLSVAVLVLAILGIVFFRYRDKELQQYTATFLDVFDTKTDIVGYATDEETFTKQVTLLKERLEEYHKLYDIYHNYEGIHNIKTINDQAGIAPVKVDAKIIELLKLSKEMYAQTNGQINVAMGSVLTIWHKYREEGRNNPDRASLPTMEELTKANEHTDIEKLIIDEKASTVYLADKEMSIDVGSIGKGYAVQKVAEYAQELGIENILFSVGGNICAVGNRLDGSGFRLGIQNPDLNSQEQFLHKVQLTNMSLVTSGDYQRYYMVDGKKYCHIIDADTLMPAEYFSAVTILAKDSGVADALSTSVFNMTLEDGKALIDAMDGVEAIWVLHDGTIEYSQHFKDYILE